MKTKCILFPTHFELQYRNKKKQEIQVHFTGHFPSGLLIPAGVSLRVLGKVVALKYLGLLLLLLLDQSNKYGGEYIHLLLEGHNPLCIFTLNSEEWHRSESS